MINNYQLVLHLQNLLSRQVILTIVHLLSYSYVNIDAEGNETSATQYANSYRGIENPFGHVWKNTIDTLVHYNKQTQNNDVLTSLIYHDL